MIDFNFVFFVFFKNSNNLVKFLNLKKFYDWHLYHKVLYDSCDYKFKKKIIILSKNILNENKNFKNSQIMYFKKMYKIYKSNYKKLINTLIFQTNKFKHLGKYYEFKYILILKLKNFFSNKFKNNILNNELNNLIKFSDSSMNKYISYKSLKKFNFFFLRKNRIFNKSRYSRNRQLYRTGFYWCL